MAFLARLLHFSYDIIAAFVYIGHAEYFTGRDWPILFDAI